MRQHTKLTNVAGRIRYISSEEEQEYLYAVYDTAPEGFWQDLAGENQRDYKRSGTSGNCIEARELIINKNVGGGMIPKLNNCIDAIENGVSRVHIMDGRIPHCVLLEIFTNKGIGTAFLSSDEPRYYKGE